MAENIREKITKAVTDRKIPLPELAKRLFMTERQLKVLLAGWNVSIPKKREYKKVQRPDRNTLMVLYRKEGTTEKLAAIYEVGINTVNRWMRDLKIPTRRMKMGAEEKQRFLEEHIGQLGDIKL